MAVQSKVWGWRREREKRVERAAEPLREEGLPALRIGGLGATTARLINTVAAAGPWRLGFAVVVSLNILLNIAWVATTRTGLKDLGSFLHSGVNYRNGLNPYSYETSVYPQPISVQGLNLNPPISVYGFDYLSRLPTGLVATLFMVTSVVLLGVVVALLMRTYPDKRNVLVLLAVASLAGVWHMVWYLQLYAPLILAITCSWLLVRRGNLVMAGILLGLVVAMKPNFGLVILALLAARHFKVAFAAGGTAALISAAPLLISGPSIYEQWLELISSFKGLVWTSNASIVSAGARFGSPLLGYTLATIALLLVLYWQWRFRPPLLQSMAAAITAAVLIGPVSWAGYTLFLLPYLFSQRWDRRLWMAVLMLDMPFAPKLLAAMLGFDIPMAPANSLTLFTALTASVYVWAMMLLMHHTLTEGLPRRSPATRLEQAHAIPVRAY